MRALFNTAREFAQDVYRNIVSLRESQDLFDDLTAGDEHLSSVAVEVEQYVKRGIPLGVIERGFAYSTAIGYPFEVEPFMASRFGDGRSGVWYGGLELETTIYESAYHMMRAELAVAGNDGVVVRERAVYRVFLDAVMFDLTGKCDDFPDLVANDYSFTQQVGRRMREEGHPGLLVRSARYEEGTNSVVFNPAVLTNPRISCYLTYIFNPRTLAVQVERTPGETLMIVEGVRWF
jgi:RES domain